MASTEAKIIRQWTLLRILSARRFGATYQELAHETGFGCRTIQRDIILLARLGFPLKEVSGEHNLKRWLIDEDSGLTQLRFTLEEAAALYLGRQFLEPLAGTLFHSGAISSFQKIRASLGESSLRHLEKLAATFYQTRPGWTDYSTKAQLIDDLSVAIEERRLTVITYQSLKSTEPVTFYDVDPYAIVFHRSALYLIAYSNDHKEVRTFKIDRISSIEVQGLTFPAPSGFNIQRLLENSFGIFEGKGQPVKVRVSFRAKVVRILEEKLFHPSQKLLPQSDGSVIAEFQLSTFLEFASWILSFGPEAEVIEPPAVRSQIVEMLRATFENYAETSAAEIDNPARQQGRRSMRRPR